MNILLITPQFITKSNFGGVAISYYRYAKILTDIGHNVHVISSGYHPKHSETISYKNKKITVHYLNNSSIPQPIRFFYFALPFGPIRFLIKLINEQLLNIIDWNLSSLFLFKKINKQHNFKIIISPPYGMPVALIKIFFKNIYYIITDHGSPTLFAKYNLTLHHATISKLENYYLSYFSNLIISCSTFQYKKTRKYILNKNIDNIIINNTLPEPSSYYKNNVDININNIVFLGTLSFRKGADLALKSFVKLAKNNKEVHLYFIGNDITLFQVAKNKLSFEDYIKNKNISSDIKSRIHVLPHINNYHTTIHMLKKLKAYILESTATVFPFCNFNIYS